MRNKIMVGLIVLVLASTGLVMLYRSAKSSSLPTGTPPINMGYNVCLHLDGKAEILKNATRVRNQHIQSAWIDSSKQFYSKTIRYNRDTLHISTLTKITFPEAVKLLQSHTHHQLKEGEVEGVAFPAYKILIRKGDAYIFRLLLAQRSFKAAVVIEAVSADKAAIEKMYNDPDWPARLKPCI